MIGQHNDGHARPIRPPGDRLSRHLGVVPSFEQRPASDGVPDVDARWLPRSDFRAVRENTIEVGSEKPNSRPVPNRATAPAGSRSPSSRVNGGPSGWGVSAGAAADGSGGSAGGSPPPRPYGRRNAGDDNPDQCGS